MERVGGDELTKMIYKSEVDAVGVRGRSPEKWEERGNRRLRGMVNATEECTQRIKWRLLSWPHPRRSSQKQESEQIRLD